MPYWAPLADIPMISTAPRFAETKAIPVTQAGRDRPEVRKPSAVAALARAMSPTPMTKAK